VVATPGVPQSAIQPPPQSSPITSLWWALDGKTVCVNDAGGIETVYDAVSGKQQSAFARSFRP
jgi:hypothetical protein